MEFKLGDVVMLKSGGPLMTITAIKGRTVSCIWFVDSAPKWHAFDAAVLKAQSNEPAPGGTISVVRSPNPMSGM